MSATGQQTLTFISERVRQAVQARHDLLAARGIAKAVNVRARFVRWAMRYHTEDMARRIGLGKGPAPDPCTDRTATRP